MYYGGMGYYSSMIVLIPAMIFTMIVQAELSGRTPDILKWRTVGA